MKLKVSAIMLNGGVIAFIKKLKKGSFDNFWKKNFKVFVGDKSYFERVVADVWELFKKLFAKKKSGDGMLEKN